MALEPITIFAAKNIDGKTVGNTIIASLPNPAPERFYTLQAFIGEGPGGISNVVTPPTISIGAISPNYTDIAAALAVSSSLGAAKYQFVPLVTTPESVGTATDLVLRVSVAANATNYRFSVFVIGTFGDAGAP